MLTDTIEDARKEMDKTVEAFRHELARVRTGRASTALVENLQVNYYGAKTPLRQLAGLSAPEPRLIVITPYDKGAMHEIEKAIQASDLGLMPMNDGKLIRIPIPELTEERRKDLVKHVRKIGEEFRVGIRNHRRDANDMLKEMHKEKQATEDEMRTGEAKVQQYTTEFIEKIDKVLTAKEAEIMEV
ncbi:MAG: ribosome recycling factor [Candidatus Binatus sp.]|jgi:ribosome recycling factor|uniref:ribosome recycling factor n=1 Tax=Candidatus Binatus sp. TaxID=2811406 RepID=UPI003D0B0845